MFDVYNVHNITIVKGKGAKVWDDKGQEYLDMYGGHAVISIGHAHPSYVQAITKQISELGFYSNSVKIALQDELAQKLGKLSGKEDYQLFLCNSGAEANENAMKLASFVTGRKKIVAFGHAFHGRTSLAVAVTDNPKIQAPVNRTDNVITLPFNDIQALKNTFAEQGEDIAAVIIEKIQGVGGIIEATTQFCKTIRQLCDKFGALYIADEVQCGCGRTGKYYATDWAGINADIYTMAKGIGNGFPMGAIAISPAIQPVKGMLGTTFGGNHLACAAAIAVADVMDDDKLMLNATMVGCFLLEELRTIEEIKEVRGQGLMIGIEFEEDCTEIKERLLNREHVFVGSAGNNVIRLLPSLVITRHQAREFISALKRAIREA